MGIRKQIANRIPGREWIPDELNYGIDATTVNEKEAKKNPVKEFFRVFFTNKHNTVPRLVLRAQDIVDGKVAGDKDDALNYLYHEDGKNLYLRLPLRTNSIEVSPYQPSQSKNQTKTYYRYKNNAILNAWRNENNDIFDDLGSYVHNNGYAFNPLFRNVKVDRGEDENGEYVSYYKKYDYNLPIDESYAPEFYDRVYFDDLFPDIPKGTHWLNPVVVVPPDAYTNPNLRQEMKNVFAAHGILPEAVDDYSDEQIQLALQVEGSGDDVLDFMVELGWMKDWRNN